MRRLSPVSLRILTLLKETYPYRLTLTQIKKFIPMRSSDLNGYLDWLSKEGLILKYYQRDTKHYNYCLSEDGFSALVRKRTAQELIKILEEVKG
jgi:predicted transcriptional regulator with HTH domain